MIKLTALIMYLSEWSFADNIQKTYVCSQIVLLVLVALSDYFHRLREGLRKQQIIHFGG